jgi:hypothetical protein
MLDELAATLHVDDHPVDVKNDHTRTTLPRGCGVRRGGM